MVGHLNMTIRNLLEHLLVKDYEIGFGDVTGKSTALWLF